MSETPERKDAEAPDENRLIAERRRKLAELREAGQAYPNDFRATTTTAALRQRFEAQSGEALAAVDETFAIAGRMMAKRVMGKIAFVRLQDHSGSIQLVVQRDNLAAGVFEHFGHWDVGDLVGASGRIFRTQKGELSL
jgi:lysyl-tRNA synthetase class 2